MTRVCFDNRSRHTPEQIMNSDTGNVIGIYQSSMIVGTDASDTEEFPTSKTLEKTELRLVVH